ncbi:MAG: trehalase family glycosidase [Planctomycetota bacterium]
MPDTFVKPKQHESIAWTKSPRTPFSTFGSYLSVQTLSHARLGVEEPGHGVYLCGHVSRGRGKREVVRLRLLDDKREPIQTLAQPKGEQLTLSTPEQTGELTLCFDGPDTLRVFGHHQLGLRLDAIEHPWVAGTAYPHDEQRWVLNATPNTLRLGLDPIVGDIHANLTWQPGGNLRRMAFDLLPQDDHLDVAVDYFQSTWAPEPRDHLDDVLERASRSFQNFADAMPDAPPRFDTIRTAAARTLWASTIAPYGLLKRPTVLMSKVIMDQVWSWDHCFNAIALVGGLPDLAWDQLMVVLDHQDEHGALPDAMSALFKHYNYSKPPVHGWALREMLLKQPDLLDPPGRLHEIRTRLDRWTRWWLTHRIAPSQQLPHYLHGNDSGWDNSTMFDRGVPLITPDLTALLALQLETQADLARQSGDDTTANQHTATSARMIDTLIDQLWRGDTFVARKLIGGGEVRCLSLVPLIPLVLGHRLPTSVAEAMIAALPAFLTDYGLATERPDSPAYEADGYWRGPIWAPPTLLIVSGLRDLNQHALADDIAERFCRTCANGFAENFEATTGKPLKDPSYTWTAAAMLILGQQLTQRQPA